MPRIRLLTSVAGGPVSGAAGDEVEVTAEIAAVWADGVRAELVEPVTKRRQAAVERAVTIDRTTRG